MPPDYIEELQRVLTNRNRLPTKKAALYVYGQLDKAVGVARVIELAVRQGGYSHYQQYGSENFHDRSMASCCDSDHRRRWTTKEVPTEAASLSLYLPPGLRSAARSPQRDPSLALSDEVPQGPATAVATGATIESINANRTIRVTPNFLP